MDLIIDGNAFINVAISVTKSVSFKDKRIGEKYYVNDLFNENSFLLKDSIKISFRNFCLTYFNSIIAPIGPALNRVHFVFDSKSWRKEYIADFFKTSTFTTSSAPTEFKYKGKRKYDEFQYLFFDYFQQTLIPVLQAQCGVNHYRFKGTEGDDSIAYLCDIIEDDILIYSVDQDLKQLVGRHDKNIMLIVPKQMSKTKKLFLSNNLVIPDNKVEELDFFALDDSSIAVSPVEKLIKSLENKGYHQFKVDPIEEVLSKILLGDKSDNIPKLDRLTPSKSKQIIDATYSRFGDNTLGLLDVLDETLILFLLEKIVSLNKIKTQDKIDETRKHLIFNIRIIRLSINIFPEEIRSHLEEFFKEYIMTKFNSKQFLTIKNNPTLL